MKDPARELVRTVAWRFLKSSGSERLELWREQDGWTLEGAVQDAFEERLRVSYVVRCSSVTRLAERGWLYRSDTFRAELEVDDLGLVTTYEGIWERA